MKSQQISKSRSHDTPRDTQLLRRAAPASVPVLALNPRLGNQAVQHLLRAGVIQAKLTIGNPDDAHEQEADRVADEVVRMPDPVHPAALRPGSEPRISRLQRKCDACEEEEVQRQPVENEEEQTLQAKSHTGARADVNSVIEAQIDGLRGNGRPLPDLVRSFMERRFNADLGAVRIHEDASAGSLARSLEAQAFTVGRHVVFGEGYYAPDKEHGRRLLAHELTHVLQQSGWSPLAAPTDREPNPARGAEGSALPGSRGNDFFPDVRMHVPAMPPRISRQVAPAAAAPAEPTYSIDPEDPALFPELLVELDRVGVPQSSESISLAIAGHSIEVTTDQILELRATAARSMRRAAFFARNSADADLAGYEYQLAIDRRHPIVAPIVHFAGRVRDPGPELVARIAEVRAGEAEVRAAVSGARFVDALQALQSEERASHEVHRLWREFHDGIISSGEERVRELAFTRDASFLTLGVLAIIASGGAAATTAFGVGLESATTAATVVSVGAPIVARTGEAVVQTALGEQVDWTRVGLDTVVDLVLVRFGGRLAQGLFQRLGGNPAVQTLGPDLARRVFASVIMHEGTTVLRVAVDATYRQVRGQPVSWEQFCESLLDQMTDPRGIFIAVLMGAVQTAADRRHGTPREFLVRRAGRTDAAEIDEMRGGTLYEDKSARRLYRPEPRTPQQIAAEETAWAQDHIYDDTVRRLEGISVSGFETTPGTRSGSTQTIPSLHQVRASRRLVFRIEADAPGLRSAVSAQLQNLRARFPDWTFEAIFNYRPVTQ